MCELQYKDHNNTRWLLYLYFFLIDFPFSQRAAVLISSLSDSTYTETAKAAHIQRNTRGALNVTYGG